LSPDVRLTNASGCGFALPTLSLNATDDSHGIKRQALLVKFESRGFGGFVEPGFETEFSPRKLQLLNQQLCNAHGIAAITIGDARHSGQVRVFNSAAVESFMLLVNGFGAMEVRCGGQ